MKEIQTPVIQFIGYRVIDISFKCSAAFEFPEEAISYKFNFGKTLAMLSENDIQENLKVNVFYSETGNMDDASYLLTIEIAGRFHSDSEWRPDFEKNALAILFPYLRALVSVITSNSGREPIILPTVNIINLFETNEVL